MPETKKFNTKSSESTEQFKLKTEHKNVRKAGKTLLVKSVSSTLPETLFDGLEGLQTKVKSNESYFLTFDTPNNSLKALKKLKLNPDLRLKFSYYKLFVKLSNMTESTEYDKLKEELSKYVQEKTNSNVLYCKFYKKDNKYLGCGDLTVDTLESLTTLLNKELCYKEFTLGPHQCVFYRYNKKEESKPEFK